MTPIDQDLAAMAQTLDESGEYRVLRRLAFRQRFSTPTELTKVGILLDVETTGLDTASDEVVELGMVKFAAAVASAPSPARSAHITRAPRDASASADDFPIPEAAPSTTAVLPVRSKSLR